MPKRAFISYSHDSQEHKEWVAKLATTLRQNGVDVVLDQWDMDYGDNLSQFIERGITRSDRVIAVCTDQYISKANEGTGGVGYEKTICTAEMLRTAENRPKFIPVVRNVSRDEKLPTFFGDAYYVDLSDDQDKEKAVPNLIRQIHEVPKPKPPLGPSPIVPEQSPEQLAKEADDKVGSRVPLGQKQFEQRARNAILSCYDCLVELDSAIKRILEPIPHPSGRAERSPYDEYLKATRKFDQFRSSLNRNSLFIPKGSDIHVSLYCYLTAADEVLRAAQVVVSGKAPMYSGSGATPETCELFRAIRRLDAPRETAERRIREFQRSS